MKDNGNFPFLANQTGKFSSLTSRQTLLSGNPNPGNRKPVPSFFVCV